MSASDTKLIERLRNPANLGEQLESEAELTRLLKLDAELSAANAKLKYWQELAVANRKVAEDNQTRLAAVTKRKDECSNGWDEALINMETLRTELAAAQAEIAALREDLKRAQNSDEHNFNRWQTLISDEGE